MIKSFAGATFFGEKFSPTKLLTRIRNIHFRTAHEPGQIFAYTERTITPEGKVIDRPAKRLMEYGSAILDHPSNLGKPGNEIAWEDMLSFLLEHHQTLRECGVQDIDLTLIFFYQDSGGAGWHIEAEDIQKLAKLGIGLSIDWYQIDDEESYKD